LRSRRTIVQGRLPLQKWQENNAYSVPQNLSSHRSSPAVNVQWQKWLRPSFCFDPQAAGVLTSPKAVIDEGQLSQLDLSFASG
jgi:hypothetical protein